LQKKLSFLILTLLCLLSLPGFCQEDDDKLIQDLEKQNQDRLKKVQAIPQPTQFNPLEELKKLGFENITPSVLTDDKALVVIKKMMEQNSFKDAPPEDVKKLLLEKMKGKPFENYLKTHPKVLDTLVDIVRDGKALPALVGIMQRKSDLKRYAWIWLCLMILGWLFKKIFFNKEWWVVKTAVLSLLVSLGVSALSLTIFYKLFNQELSPVVSIAKKHWDR
jgi:hypothetical protein